MTDLCLQSTRSKAVVQAVFSNHAGQETTWIIMGILHSMQCVWKDQQLSRMQSLAVQ